MSGCEGENRVRTMMGVFELGNVFVLFRIGCLGCGQNCGCVWPGFVAVFGLGLWLCLAWVCGCVWPGFVAVFGVFVCRSQYEYIQSC